MAGRQSAAAVNIKNLYRPAVWPLQAARFMRSSLVGSSLDSTNNFLWGIIPDALSRVKVKSFFMTRK
jgi:hypothetical protein